MTVLAEVGGVIGALGLAVVIAGRRREERLAGLAAWALGLALLVVALAPSLPWLLLVGGGVAGLALAAGGARLLHRRPWLLAFATLVCVPIRIPVELGDDQANLLLPLYLVALSAALALARDLVVGRDSRVRELGAVALPLAVFVAWSGVTLLWSSDVREGAIALGAFVLPFGLVAVGFARLPWRGRELTRLFGLLVATAYLYAAIGVGQWFTRDVFWNPKVIVGNAYAPFFRVNSVFWDPSIYGRYLVVGILAALAGVLLRGVAGRAAWGLVAAIATLWAGLLLSFSQSSFVALAAGTVLAATIVWGRRAFVAAAALGLLVGALVIAAPQTRERAFDESRSQLDRVTSGRASLVGHGIRLVGERPVHGVGIGAFERTVAERAGLPRRASSRAASHTTPLTVAAETGLPGLLLFGWLVFTALRAALTGLGTGFTSRVSFAVGLTLAAITVHSIFYSGFFEDPMTWALLGLVGLATSVPRRAPRSVTEARA